jgi:hypothetical protein
MTITGFVTRVRRRVSLVEQVMNTLPEHISPPVFGGVHIVDLFCVMFCRSLFVLFLLVIVLYVFLRLTDSDYPCGIFKLFSFPFAFVNIKGPGTNI